MFNFISRLFLTGSKYYLNDPSTPQLSEDPVMPPTPKYLPVSVEGLSKVSSPVGDQAKNCQITIYRALNNFQEIIQKFDKPVEHWASSRTLHVTPRAGKDLNAFYDRRALKFFYDVNPATGQTVYTVNSVDVVSHELGHGLLDAMRPEFWNTQALEIWAFHEAFGDITAIATSLRHEKIITLILEETNGNLSKSNTLSRVAEELGSAIYNGRNYLRDASIHYNYVNPSGLPQSDADERLSAECHSFSRVFTSAWYEIFVQIFELEKKLLGPVSALKLAGEVAYGLLLKAVRLAPATLKYTEAVAKGMVYADQLRGGKYNHILKNVFQNRKIIMPIVKMLSNTTWDDVKVKLNDQDEVTKRGSLLLVHKKKQKTMKISDHLVSELSGNSNPLYDVEMDVPADVFYHFDKNGNLVDEYEAEEQELLQSSVLCALAINSYDKLGKGKMWNVVDNKLVRNHIECKGCK